MILVREKLKGYHNLDETTRLDLDRVISILLEKEILSNQDIKIIESMKNQCSTVDIAREMSFSRATVYRKMDLVSDKIAQHLGEAYQDNMILLQVEEKLGRKLTEDEEKFCWYTIRHLGKVGKKTIFNFKIKDGKIINGEDKKER